MSAAFDALRVSMRDLDWPKPRSGKPRVRTAPVPCGIYMLVKDEEIIYVGSSIDIQVRVDTHRYSYDFDSILWVSIPKRLFLHYEGAFIRALRPPLNRSCPRHRECDNEILEGFGLQPHEDEYANAADWSVDNAFDLNACDDCPTDDGGSTDPEPPQ